LVFTNRERSEWTLQVSPRFVVDYDSGNEGEAMPETDLQAALAAFAAELSASFAKLATALGGGSSRTGSTSSDGVEQTTQQTPWSTRLLRQSQIIKEIIDAGGSVPQQTWYEIAARHGYTGRGLAGFFRSNGGGLLDMRKDKVYVTKRGRERLAQNKGRVQAAMDGIAS
jgi:hypothetical protein